MGINIRPYAVECLTELAKEFELIVFTASHQSYADHVIDMLDPNHTLFSYRLFRNNCIQASNGMYIKDLRILNRELSRVLIVDNSILSFAMQIDNGVPIVPFYNDKNDSILLKLKDYILSLKDQEDFRFGNLTMFGMRYLYEPSVQSFLTYSLMMNQETGKSDTCQLIVGGKRSLLINEEVSELKKIK